jgi:RNA polymerase sigma factor (sigma-70 family)
MARIDPHTLGRLFDEHGRSLLLFGRQWCDAPDDIVQDAFVALARQDVVPDQVVPWLYRVVRNGAIAAARQTSRRRRREQRAASVEAVLSEPWFASTDDQIDAQHASQLLADLDGETREAIVARLWGGLTFEEIAQLQGCSLSTTYRRYQAGLARLQERLEPRWKATKHSPTTKYRDCTCHAGAV